MFAIRVDLYRISRCLPFIISNRGKNNHGGDICESEFGTVEYACRPQSPRQHAMLPGHSASAPILGASLHWWHGLSSVHLAGAAPRRAGFVTGNAGRLRVSP